MRSNLKRRSLLFLDRSTFQDVIFHFLKICTNESPFCEIRNYEYQSKFDSILFTRSDFFILVNLVDLFRPLHPKPVYALSKFTFKIAHIHCWR
jgi:hypothetical protein